MKKIIAIAAAVSLAPLAAACGQSPDEAAADVAEQTVEAQEDIIEEQADLQESLGNEAQADVIDDRADAVGELREDGNMPEDADDNDMN